VSFAASISAPVGVFLNAAALPKSRDDSYTGFGRLRASGETCRSITVESCDSRTTWRRWRTQGGRDRPPLSQGRSGELPSHEARWTCGSSASAEVIMAGGGVTRLRPEPG